MYYIEAGKMEQRISEIEAALLNCQETLDPEVLASYEEELFHLNHIKELWAAFGDVPMDPQTECIEEEWNHFPAGTFREDIWHWFEREFGVSVAEDLMGV